MTPNFDRIARPYRWLEYLTLGRALERTREHFLPHLPDRRHALILGDGDGRFTARLMTTNPRIAVHAVDISPTMLQLLTARAPRDGRLTTQLGSALDVTPPCRPDLIVTHFFLDCLTQPEIDRLVGHLAEELLPGGIWVVSEFRIPSGWMHLPARLMVRGLYAAFRILTGLRVTSLPDHRIPMRRAGLILHEQSFRLCGLLVSELWQLSTPSIPRTSAFPPDTTRYTPHEVGSARAGRPSGRTSS